MVSYNESVVFYGVLLRQFVCTVKVGGKLV